MLVADDDPECRLLLSAMAAKAGYHVDAVADGDMALTMMQSLPPDLVLLDAQLPHRDGFDVCGAIKSDPRMRSTPVIMLTGHVTDQARVRALAVGADEFVTKPFRAEHLLEVIDQLIKIRDAALQLDVEPAAVAGALGRR